MKIRFAVLTNGKDFEVSGSYLLNDEEVKETVVDQAVSRSKDGEIGWYEMDMDTLETRRVEMQCQEDG